LVTLRICAPFTDRTHTYNTVIGGSARSTLLKVGNNICRPCISTCCQMFDAHLHHLRPAGIASHHHHSCLARLPRWISHWLGYCAAPPFLFLKKGTEVNSSRSSGFQRGEMMLSSTGMNSRAFNVAGMWLHYVGYICIAQHMWDASMVCFHQFILS
jgi:hypothetical protein